MLEPETPYLLVVTLSMVLWGLFFLCMVFCETDTVMKYAIYLIGCLLLRHSLWWEPSKFRVLFLFLYWHSSTLCRGWWILKIHTPRQWCRHMGQHSPCYSLVSMYMTYLVPWISISINRPVSLQLTILKILTYRRVRISLKNTANAVTAWITWYSRTLAWRFLKFILPVTLGVVQSVL